MNAPKTTRRLTGQHNQCPGCGELFNSNHSFDMHRFGIHGRSRRCLTVDEMQALGMSKNAGGWWISKEREVGAVYD